MSEFASLAFGLLSIVFALMAYIVARLVADEAAKPVLFAVFLALALGSLKMAAGP